jgi:hypothetical protein
LAWIGVRENTQPGLPPAADELQHDFTPVRAGAMLGDVDALPSPERECPGDHGDVERHTREHGLYMRRHIVRPLDIMNPVGIGGREAIERAHKVGAYVGIGVFLDDEARPTYAA